ncbi:hypothetical protein QN362_14555 [Actimicrobium sp. CCC2.4]|nr:hypothetical protein [Actimicrobium sp. CCC2.4]MEB0136557.1 hypothetical protein [Actimicrobium sp. CCC2.4]WPX31757.1 hypothetical protein RHM62_16185 [Actimicrobium sp. CCC2.4]
MPSKNPKKGRFFRAMTDAVVHRGLPWCSASVAIAGVGAVAGAAPRR